MEKLNSKSERKSQRKPRSSEVKQEKEPSKSKKSPAVEKIKITGKLPLLDTLSDQSGFNGKLYFISQILALITIALVACWLIEYFGGFGIDAIDQIINYHPLIMVFSMIYILSNSLLFLNSSKSFQGIRVIFCILILAIGFVGSVISIYWHSKENIPHFQSLHSWLGLMTWILLAVYFTFGYHVYFRIGYSEFQRIQMLYYLRMLGIATMILAGATCLIALNQILLLKELARPTHEDNKLEKLSRPNIVTNIIGLFLINYIVYMIHMVVNLRYKPRSAIRREIIEKQLRCSIQRAINKLEQEAAFDEYGEEDDKETKTNPIFKTNIDKSSE